MPTNDEAGFSLIDIIFAMLILLSCCLIKDLFSNRISGYSINERMTNKLAVNASSSAIAGCRFVVTVIVHSDRGSQGRFVLGTSSLCSKPLDCPARWAESPSPATTPRWNRSNRYCRRTSSTANIGRPETTFATRSSTGPSRPTTGATGNAAWACSPRRIRTRPHRPGNMIKTQ